jgi:hypothetical protein
VITRVGVAAVLAALLAGSAFLYAQKPFKQYRETAEGYGDYPLPDHWDRPSEWIFARLKYPDLFRLEFGIDRYWTMDYPRGDRHLAQGIRRLTTLDARPVEQVVELDGSDDIYNWPFLYAVEVGFMDLDEEKAEQLRKYLDRGGFLMVDDFHGEPEWENFLYNLDLVMPDALIEDLSPRDPIFHTVSDVNELIQIPSEGYVVTGLTYEKGGVTPHFRAVRDKKGRIAIVICHNMDLGDSIEHSDNPEYAERFSALGYRVLTNYVVYNLTH